MKNEKCDSSKMEIKILPKSVQESLKTGTAIKSVPHCITQLVFNCLDARATSIAVRVNLITYNIQVIDNGTGISRNNFDLVGQRYATSKYLSTRQLKMAPNLFGQRGTALASIIKLARIVRITSRRDGTPAETWTKSFENGTSTGVSGTAERASKGTTVEIENFMYNLPVRRSRMKPNGCIEAVRNEIETIALIHPTCSFSVRHDPSGEVTFQTYRVTHVHQTCSQLYGGPFSSRQLRKIQHSNGTYTVTGVISVSAHSHRRIQRVYVNKRPVLRTRIHGVIDGLLGRSKIGRSEAGGKRHQYGVYIVNIKCARYTYDIVDFNDVLIEFQDWDALLSCVEQAVQQFLVKQNLLLAPVAREIGAGHNHQVGTPVTEEPVQVRTSQYDGVIRGVCVKRKQNNDDVVKPEGKRNDSVGSGTRDNVDEGMRGKKRAKRRSTKTIRKKSPARDGNETNSVVDLISDSKSDDDEEEEEEEVEKPGGNVKTAKEIVRAIINKVQRPKRMYKYNPLQITAGQKTSNVNNSTQFLKSLNCAKDIILEMFLKSTALFTIDVDLKEELAGKEKESVVDKAAGEGCKEDEQTVHRHTAKWKKPDNVGKHRIQNHNINQRASNNEVSNPNKGETSKEPPRMQVNRPNIRANVTKQTNREPENCKPLDNRQIANVNQRDYLTDNLNRSTKPALMSKATQVSASLLPDLNWHPAVRRIDPLQVLDPSNTRRNVKSSTPISQAIERHKRYREQQQQQQQQQARVRKYSANFQQTPRHPHVQEALFNKPRNAQPQNKFRINLQVQNVQRISRLNDNQPRINRNKQDRYDGYRRGCHHGKKIALTTRLNFRLVSMCTSTAAHRTLTAFRRYDQCKYTIRGTVTQRRFVRSTDFLRPVLLKHLSRATPGLNPRSGVHVGSMTQTRFASKQQNVSQRRHLPLWLENNDQGRRKHLPYTAAAELDTGTRKEKDYGTFLKVPDHFTNRETEKWPTTSQRFDFEKCFKIPEISKKRNFEMDNRYNVRNHGINCQNCFKMSDIPKPRRTQAMNSFEENASCHNFTIPQSVDVTFSTNVPDNNDQEPLYKTQGNLPDVLELFTPSQSSTSPVLQNKDDDPYQINNNIARTVLGTSFAPIHKVPEPCEDTLISISQIPEAPADTFVPFSTNPTLNKSSTTRYPRPNGSLHLDSEEPSSGLQDSWKCLTESARQRSPNDCHQQPAENEGPISACQRMTPRAEPISIASTGNTLPLQREWQQFEFVNRKHISSTPVEGTGAVNVSASSSWHNLPEIQGERIADSNRAISETPVSKMGHFTHDFMMIPGTKNTSHSVANTSFNLRRNTVDDFGNSGSSDGNNVVEEAQTHHQDVNGNDVPGYNSNAALLNPVVLDPPREDIQQLDATMSTSVVSEQNEEYFRHTLHNTSSNRKRSLLLPLNHVDASDGINDNRSLNSPIPGHSANSMELTRIFQPENMETSMQPEKNLNNIVDVPGSNRTIENILADFTSMRSPEAEHNLASKNGILNKSIMEMSRNMIGSHYNPNANASNVSAVEDVLMDLENIINSSDTTINLTKTTTCISDRCSNSVPNNPVLVNNETSKVDRLADDFEITFEYDPQFNLEIPRSGSFQRNYSNNSLREKENYFNTSNNNSNPIRINEQQFNQQETVNTANQVTNNVPAFFNFINKQTDAINSVETVKEADERSGEANSETLEPTATCTLNKADKISNDSKVETESKLGDSKNIDNDTETVSVNTNMNDNVQLASGKSATADRKSLMSNCSSSNPTLRTSRRYTSANRPAFLPKGMSPILYAVSTAPIKELSQKSKKLLHEVMAKNEHNDLQTVKWMKYFDTKDAKTFFSDMYSDKRNYEKTVPNLNGKVLPKKVIEALGNFTFSKDCFNSLKVICQWDTKFIVTSIVLGANRHKLVLFDQHAVHERIRLECLLKEYALNETKHLKSTKCSLKIKLQLEQFDMRMLKNYRETFGAWGLVYKIKDKDTVTFNRIPMCWKSSQDEGINDENTNIASLIQELIQEMGNWLRNTGNLNITTMPHVILDSIKREACRGAIKFGDVLSREMCEEYLKQLSSCCLPFQCAHGRPTLVPVFNLNELHPAMQATQISWNKLKSTNKQIEGGEI